MQHGTLGEGDMLARVVSASVTGVECVRLRTHTALHVYSRACMRRLRAQKDRR